MSMLGAISVLIGIWILAVIMALPNYIWRTLSHHELDLFGIDQVNFCFEEWPHEYGRAFYSVFVLLMQYCLPIITVGVAYAKICRKLRHHIMTSTVKKSASKDKDHRMEKTIKLLIVITIVFCMSWLPFNMFNLIVDILDPFGDDTQTMLIVYGICHMIGMSSASSNPLLYGWLNENFRKEFKEILRIKPCCCCRCCSKTDISETPIVLKEQSTAEKNLIKKSTFQQDNDTSQKLLVVRACVEDFEKKSEIDL